MSTRTHDVQDVESAASAFLKAVAVALRGNDVYAAFQAVAAPAMVKGHAWRALKLHLRSVPIMRWQRAASHERATKLLLSAAATATKSRREMPDPLHPVNDNTAAKRRLRALAGMVERYVDGRLRGASHTDMSAHHLPACLR